MKIRLSLSNYFSKYYLKPLSGDLSTKDKVKAMAANIGLGMVSFGTFFIANYGINRWRGRSVEKKGVEGKSEEIFSKFRNISVEDMSKYDDELAEFINNRAYFKSKSQYVRKKDGNRGVSIAKASQGRDYLGLTKGLFEVPKEGIEVGLPNMDIEGRFGNTCWFNALLKFISSTDFFDQLLTKSVSEDHEDLQLNLRVMVNYLRSGMPIDENFYRVLVYEVQDATGTLIGQQQDPVEFLRNLMNSFSWSDSSSQKAKRVTCFQTNKRLGASKSGRESASFAILDVTLPLDLLYLKKSLNLDHWIKNPSTVSARPDGVDKSFPNITYEKKSYPTYLPDQLVLKMDRVVSFQGSPSKIENPIELNKDGLVELIEYQEVVDDSGKIEKAIPRSKVFYRIDSALIQKGEATSGHYTCHERAQNGALKEHDDMKVKYILDERKFGVNGYLIRLKKIRSEPVAVS